MRLQGKTALITDATVGIGLGCSIKFACEGAKVILLEMNAEAKKRLVNIQIMY